MFWLHADFCIFQSPLGLWVGGSEQRHVVPPPPAQWGAPVLLPVGQRLGQRLPLALWQQQNGQHGQQGQGWVDHVVQEVAVMVPQVHQWGAEAAHAAQGEHGTHATAPVQKTQKVSLSSVSFYLYNTVILFDAIKNKQILKHNTILNTMKIVTNELLYMSVNYCLHTISYHNISLYECCDDNSVSLGCIG